MFIFHQNIPGDPVQWVKEAEYLFGVYTRGNNADYRILFRGRNHSPSGMGGLKFVINEVK